ncbi:MAG: tetratricopeptide repeat protein [Planctomycetaceae bacterium]|nr:tetratricopeptide repeat protein [Planctomycetaceae bacterium]
MKLLITGCLTVLGLSTFSAISSAQPSGGGERDRHAELRRQADSAYRQRNFQQTVELTSQVLSQNPQDPIALYLRGSARVELGIASSDGNLIREGIEDARQAIQADSTNRVEFYLPYLYGMSHLTALEGNTSHAEMAVRVATDIAGREGVLTSSKSNLLYQKALAQSKLEKFADAAETLRATLEIAPNHLAAHMALADVLARNGDVGDAEAAFTKAIEQFPQNPLVFNNRGMFYQTQNRNADAIADFTSAIELDANHLQAHLNRGFTRLNIGEHAAAQGDFTRAIEISPDHAPAYALRATSQLLQNKVTEALQDYLKVIELRPSYPPARADIAFGYFFAGHYETAGQAFQQALTLNPNAKYLVPWRYASMSLAGQQNAANQEYADISGKPADQRDWFDQLTLFFMGKLEERELLTAIDSTDAGMRDAQLCEAYYFMGLKLQQQGQGDPARYFRNALQSQSKQLSAYRAAQLALNRMQQ